jgi:hypothetical protein
VSNWEKVTVTSASNSTDKPNISVSCTAGKKVLGGGGKVSDTSGKVGILNSYPSANDTWTVDAYEISGVSTNWTVSVYAICATAQ